MTKRFIEVTLADSREGVLQIEDGGFSRIGVDWLKALIVESGRTYEEYTA